MEWLKFIHVSCAVMSFTGFFIRGLWVLCDSALLTRKWVKTFPHVIDTVLLGSALSLLYVYGFSIFEYNWLLAKIVALLLYIALGMLALRFGKSKQLRAIAWLSGLLVFLYIVSVALTKSVAGFIEWI